MKAVVFHKYKSLDSLELTEVEKPIPRDNEVLVKIHATSVNSLDYDILLGIPFVNRLQFGLFRPKKRVIGCDIAGRVEKVGSKVVQFKTGDEIFGDISGAGMGGFAEYVSVPENILAPKPVNMTFEEAAAVPHAGVLALQGLRDKGHIQKGKKVLINGAGGGSGTFGLQYAKLIGAEVTCVDRQEKLDMLRKLGADRVIDYAREEFTESGQVYDLILDVVTYRSVYDYLKALAHEGRYVMLGGGSYSRVFQIFWLRPLISVMQRLSHGKKGRKMGILMHRPNQKDLNFLTELLEAGKVKPVIDRRFHLSESREAFRHYAEGLAQGKIVITV
jgi:NADPH:quinone reductase-like Zn-dependent oxidoreductase